MKKYTGTCRVKDDSNWIYKGSILPLIGFKEYKNGSGMGVHADGSREYMLDLIGTKFNEEHGWKSTLICDSDLINIELFEEVALPLNEEECLLLIEYAVDCNIRTPYSEILQNFLEDSKKPSILPTPDLSTLYSDEEWKLKNEKL